MTIMMTAARATITSTPKTTPTATPATTPALDAENTDPIHRETEGEPMGSINAHVYLPPPPMSSDVPVEDAVLVTEPDK